MVEELACIWWTMLEEKNSRCFEDQRNSYKERKEEAELIQSLVKKVLGKLDNTPIGVAKYPVGLHSRLDQLLRLLDVKANGVKVVGLYGMGGVGKTTLAKALYNQFVVYFKKRSFISDVKGTARQQNGLVTLQRKLIGDLNPGASPIIDSTAKGIQLINESANNERVAIFLDDVDDANQLRELIGGRDWFCQGSRIIVTTRDQNVLDPSIVNCTFEVTQLNLSDSLKLLSYHAFGKEQPPKKFLGLAEEFVTLSGGLPLALEIFGSSLFYKKGLKEWEDVVQKVRQIRPGELQDILEISFGALDDQERCIFLDLACLLLNTRLEREDAIAIFKGCGFAAETAITALTAKSLLKIVDGNVLWMHDQLKDMGRQIVQRENSGNVDKRSRLWNHDDIMTVLNSELVVDTSNIEGIVFDFERNQDQNSEEVSWICLILKKVLEKYIGQGRTTNGSTFHTRAFQCMVKLRLLQINHVKLVGDFKLLPADLKWLQWKGCPLEVIPPELLSRKIAVLDLSESMITQVWNEKKWNLYQNKDSLRHMQYLCVPGDDLPDWFIHEVPNFSTRKHRDLKAVIIGIVLSLDQQVEDNFRHQVPAIVDIRATFTTPGDAKPKHTKTLYLLGVPDTDEDQLYLCRFQEHSFTLMLKEGDRLQVVVRECPCFNGLKLKKHGMHLVFENDDDFDNNDEDLFDESQQSVSRKLANFFHFQK
ncbi:hypothetical protein KY290_024280 [Solanum tuberosum]|uniref:AAA+ ATPase domain-containing protein n=1 Tax=Solanum tuberosum TaxID=4113 RepID=A0ABQ7UQA7_SOLTU|nr:hypothetical protein KY290_024280 [Solanum tuberosum]